MVQHVFLVLRNQEPIFELSAFGFERGLTLGLSLSLQFLFDLPFFEVIERLNEFLGKKALIFIEPPSLRAKGSALNVLNLEFDDLAGDGGDVNIEVGLHH
jgi:hypothetical protein